MESHRRQRKRVGGIRINFFQTVCDGIQYGVVGIYTEAY